LKNWKSNDSVHPDDLPRVIAAWRYSITTGHPLEYEHRLRGADGVYRWFYLRGLPLRDSAGAIIRWYVLLTDVNDRKNAEEALRGTQARLSRAAQIATVGELAASIAHEVNQPLAAVVANGHACLRWLSTPTPNVAKALEAAERIVRDGKEAGEVVRRVRSLFKRAAAERMSLDVNDLIGEVLRVLDVERVRKDVSVETDLARDLPPVLGDRVELQQLVLNLLVNGLDAMDSVTDRPRQLFIRSTRHNDVMARVEIRDNGSGLEDPARVFEAFFTTKPNGLGMGLVICRSIVDAHGGQLWATASDPPGSTFCFTLPFWPTPPHER
jgi:C4-dicarboxylate-specific signal transduction histidine kinase